MFNFNKFIARLLFLGCVLTISLLIGFSSRVNTVVHSSDPPVLTLDAGNGVKAEFSNYTLSNYSEADGVYSGRFCFTLKNITQRPTTPAPFYLTQVGFQSADNAGVEFYPNVNDYSISGSFVGKVDSSPVFNIFFNYYSVILSKDRENGIPLNQTASFCLMLRSSNPFNLSGLISKFSVVFDDGLPARAVIVPQSNSSRVEGAEIVISKFSDNEICFSVLNCALSNQVVTGVGFDLPGSRGLFSLVSISGGSRGRFRFTISPNRLRYIDNIGSGKLDFGILTGQLFAKGLPQFGLPKSNGSSQYCVSGNFRGLKLIDVLNSAVIRFENNWGVRNDLRPPCFVYGGAIRGVVASNPR